jgi:hypothetical protein
MVNVTEDEAQEGQRDEPRQYAKQGVRKPENRQCLDVPLHAAVG